MEPASTPVVFVHGLWLHATSWDPWVELFKEAGYNPIAPGWPGDADTVAETRSHPEQVAGKGIEDVVQHYAEIIHGLPAKPVVIGHSFGGLIVQRLLGQDLAAAAVAIDPAPIKGVLNLPVSALRVASIALRRPANRNEAQALTPEQFRYGFGNALPSSESAELYDRYAIRPRASRCSRPRWPTSPPDRRPRLTRATRPGGPLLLTSGGQDHTVPPAIVHATRRLHHRSPAITDLREFPDLGHSLTIDHGWRDVAQESLNWLQRCLR